MDIDFLNLPKLDDIEFDTCFYQVPLSVFCKRLGIDVDTFMESLNNE